MGRDGDERGEPPPGDIALDDDYARIGLPAPSLIRTEKLAVIEANVAEWRGDIGAGHLSEVRDRLRVHLGLAVPELS